MSKLRKGMELVQKGMELVQKLIIIVLFLLNFGLFIYTRLFHASYNVILGLSTKLFDYTLTGILIFLVLNFFLIITSDTKAKWVYTLKSLILIMLMFLVTLASTYPNGHFVHIMRFIGVVFFFERIFIIYFVFIVILVVAAVIIVWKVYNFSFHFAYVILFALGFIILFDHSVKFIGIASYTPKLPWWPSVGISQNNCRYKDDCIIPVSTPVLFAKTTLSDPEFTKLFNYYIGYKIECKATYVYRSFAYDYAKRVSNINILTGLFMFFIIVIAGYKVRIEFYLAILASLMALANSSLFAFYYKISIKADFTFLKNLAISNDFHFIMSIILPATLLLRDKTFLKLLIFDISVYFILNFIVHSLPVETGYLITTVTDIIFMGLGFIFLYKYYKTSNENPELIEKNRFLKEYLD